MSFSVVRKIGHVFRDGVHRYQVAALISGDVLRRYLEEPWNTPPGATAIPAGFICKEHTHSQDMPGLLPGHLAGASDTWSLSIGDDLQISVNGGATQTATLQAGDAVNFAAMTAPEMVAVFARDFSGASGRFHPHLGFNHLFLVSDDQLQTVQVTGGTMNAVLQFPTTLAFGDQNNGEQTIFHADDFDGVQYLVDIVDTNQLHTDLAPTLRSWDAILNP